MEIYISANSMRVKGCAAASRHDSQEFCRYHEKKKRFIQHDFVASVQCDTVHRVQMLIIYRIGYICGWMAVSAWNSVERKYYNTIDFTPNRNHRQSIHYCIILNAWVAISYIRLLWLQHYTSKHRHSEFGEYDPTCPLYLSQAPIL
jgi:hypothetical protein